MIHIANYTTLFMTLPLIGIAILYYIWGKKRVLYRHSTVSLLKKEGVASPSVPRYLLFFLRLSILCILAILIAKLQFFDTKIPNTTDGIDIVLALDLSGSMQCFDDERDQRSRFDVAQQEAIKFVEKRDNDAIGIVIFAQQAVSRCPLTLDKKMLKGILQELHLGSINPDGTMLATALLTATNRLKKSQAKTKIIILLTDGAPTPGDIAPEIAMNLLKKLGIKVYTVGVGNNAGGFLRHPLFGVIPAQSQFNVQLLQDIAQQTGGKFFHAQSPADMKAIYEQIDTLERSKQESLLYKNVQDWFLPLLYMALLLVIIELWMTAGVWFGL